MEESGKRRSKRMVSVAARSVGESRRKNDQVKGGIKVFNGQETSSIQVKQSRLTRARNGEKPQTWTSTSEKSEIVVGTDTEISESEPADLRQDEHTDPKCDCILDDTIVGNDTGAFSSVEGRVFGRRRPTPRNYTSSSKTRLKRDANYHDLASPSNCRVMGLKRTISLSEPPSADNSDKASQLQTQSPLIRKIMKLEPNRLAVTLSNNPCSSGEGDSNLYSQTEEVNCSSLLAAPTTISTSESRTNINDKAMEFNPLDLGIIATDRNSDHKQIESGEEEAKINIEASRDPDLKSQGTAEEGLKLLRGPETAAATLSCQEADACKEFRECQADLKGIATADPIGGVGDEIEKELVGGGSDIGLGKTIGIGAKKALETVKEINNNARETKTTRVVSSPKSKPLVVKKSSSITSKSFSTLKKPNPSSPRPINDSAKCTESISQSSEEFCRIPESHGRLQSLVDLVMWRDVSRSAFVFGIGSFTIISSSYAKDLNISLISTGSYVALVYLALMFLYRSIMCRGITYVEDSSQMNVLGEEEVLCILKFILPYMNELLLKMRGLFAGDPAVTMKLALMLFVLARCGNSITTWKVIKLGFFGAFIVPKLCSSYSTQITAYGKFWVGRFHDAWRSCSHKKVVAFAIFTMVWNYSSIVARAWAAFMLFVALRYYQQSLATADDDCVEDHQTELHYLQQRHIRRQHRSNMPFTKAVQQDQDLDQKKEKKSF